MTVNMKRALGAIAFSCAMTTVAFGFTQHQQQACQGDAMRLCGHFIPDHGRIHACLTAHRAHISHACRAII